MNTEIKILQLAVERLVNELDKLKIEHEALKKEIEKLRKQNRSKAVLIQPDPKVSETSLLDTKEVLRILGVCYNTLQKIVQKGLITPIKISQRRVRYSKAKIVEYLKKQQEETGAE